MNPYPLEALMALAKKRYEARLERAKELMHIPGYRKNLRKARNRYERMRQMAPHKP